MEKGGRSQCINAVAVTVIDVTTADLTFRRKAGHDWV